MAIMRRFTMGCILVSTVAVVAPQLAAASPPATTSFPFSSSQTDKSLCGFPIEFSFTGTFTERDFFDSSGNLIRIEVHSADVATVVGTSAVSFSGRDVVNIEVDLRDQTEQHTGIPLHFDGLLIDAGRILVDSAGNLIAVSGNHQILAGDLGKFCAALA